MKVTITKPLLGLGYGTDSVQMGNVAIWVVSHSPRGDGRKFGTQLPYELRLQSRHHCGRNNAKVCIETHSRTPKSPSGGLRLIIYTSKKRQSKLQTTRSMVCTPMFSHRIAIAHTQSHPRSWQASTVGTVTLNSPAWTEPKVILGSIPQCPSDTINAPIGLGQGEELTTVVRNNHHAYEPSDLVGPL